MGMALYRSTEEVNWNFIAHIIRDTCPGITSHVVNFGESQELSAVLRSSEHGIETWGLVVPKGDDTPDDTDSWIFDLNKPFYGNNFCKIFLSFNYDPPIVHSDNLTVAVNVNRFMKRDGVVIAVNPGSWISDFGHIFQKNPELENNLRSYSMLAKENVVVYKK